MKKNSLILILLLLMATLSSCGIFKRGCHCPKVSYVNFGYARPFNS